MVNLPSNDPTLELGRIAIILGDDTAWPEEIFLMASRKWESVIIDGQPFELQTSFFSGAMSELDHGMASWFFATLDDNEVRDWISTVGTKFVQNEITADWLLGQSLNHDLFERFKITMTGITTMRSSFPVGDDAKSLHLGFLLKGRV